jgi:hypothetical protein
MGCLTCQVPCELYIDGVGGSWHRRAILPCVPQAESCFFFEHSEDQFTVSSCFFSENASGGFDAVVLFNEAISEETSDGVMEVFGWEWEPEHEEAKDGTPDG